MSVLIAAIVAIILICNGIRRSEENPQTEALENADQENRLLPEQPKVISSATIGSTGDILIHIPVLDAFRTEYGYDFTDAFTYIAPYYQDADLMVANLEVPLVDPADGYDYSSNPFASPDAVAEALKDAGVDICLTANNHSYDMGHYGLMRTQAVLDRLELEHVGTRQSEEDPFVLVKDVNNIRLGMTCFTYDTGDYTNDWKSLNFILLEEEDAPLVNSFNYSNLEAFYADAAEQIRTMDQMGCEVKIFYLHWGEEYMDEPDADQETIAQRLCEMGVDIIVGGHPHVIQKLDILESRSGHQTICLYSMGNELSNQRKELMNEDDYRGYTEDGIVFTVTIEKFNNGKVKIRNVDVLPTWVQKGESYRIIPLDDSTASEEWPTFDEEAAVNSYERTMGRLGETYPIR
ncbi:MAG: CapA family protein [Parasporobacterium sp.]|nr:CapA family protein [Parasporobacterium sp.]